MHSAYELIKEKTVSDLNSKGLLYKHKKTGARVFVLSNDDDNKVFYIGFRTPPYDSTGLPHILEHSVLCGSVKYPVKDPFVELCKGSLNTFLNAMTYPDKTVYPVASCNDTDFKNLVDVYLDSVFNPKIYEHEEIFSQEGFRYEINDKDDELTINGVVYNEMKGAFSTPDDMMDREIFSTLFPDTAYGFESGGDPDVIPTLTYEKFLDFHSKYYHPSNSYIYLYGDMDVDEYLDYLDSDYLSHYEKEDIDSKLSFQEPFSDTKVIKKEYSITKDEETDDKTYLSYNVVIDTSLNRELYLAFQVIDYCLIGAPGAAITERLLKSGLVSDVDSVYENGILQPYYSIVAKGANEKDLDDFMGIIRDELSNAVSHGLDKDMIRAGINVFEFKYREADYGRYPKGLMYGLQALDSWLYDENEPFLHIEANSTYAYLKEQAETDYFEKLIEKYLLNNKHSSIVVLKPKKGLTSKKDKELKEKLANYKKSLSDDDIDALVRKTHALKEYQEKEDSPEALMKIPLLKISDIKREIKRYEYAENMAGDVKTITHEIFTNGIGYVSLCFDISSMDKYYLPYAALMCNILSYMNTKNYTYTELTNKININTGGILTVAAVLNDYVEYEAYTPFIRVRVKTLYDKLPEAFDLMHELIINTDFSDENRLLELLNMLKARIQPSILSAGHLTAFKRALSYISESEKCKELLHGLDFYGFICSLIENYDDKKAEIIKTLNDVMRFSFRKENLIVDYIGEKKTYDKVFLLVNKISEKLYTDTVVLKEHEFKLEKLNEGLKTGAKVQYVAKVGNFRKNGLKPNGALHVLKVIMGYDYLWNNIRVKGGAYGCMSGFAHNGMGHFVSYRDPKLKETLDVYDKAENYVKEFDCSKRDMTKYIIGTIAEFDTPLTPYDEGNASFMAYLSHKTNADKQRLRDEILTCDISKIRALSDYIREIISDDAICVIGSEDKIEENRELFLVVRELF